MKKQWIAEALYIIVAVVFIGICIGTGKAGEREAFGTNVTGTPEATPTLTPGQAPGTISGAMQENNLTGVPDMTSAPVQGTIPTVEPGQTYDGTPSPIPGQASDITSTPTPGQALDGQDTTPAPTGTNITPTPTVAPEEARLPGRLPGAIEIKNENYEQYSNEKFSWWFRRNENHKPSGSGESFPIEEYSAYYLDRTATEEDKVFYITFDCGYENGFTPTILDTLAEKNVKAMFFVTKDFVVKNPEYVKRMKEEGHLVGNHTVRHLSSPTLTPEELAEELYEVAIAVEEETGYSIDPFFRTPMGEYSERVLKVVQDMGYTSAFWSIAYYDYDVNNQPGKDYVVDHFNTYHHNGCIALIHNTSESNAQALGDVLDLLREAGYRFGTLTELGN